DQDSAYRWKRLLARLQPFVTGAKQRLRFRQFTLPQQRAAQQAAGVEGEAIVRSKLLANRQALPSEWFGLRKAGFQQTHVRTLGKEAGDRCAFPVATLANRGEDLPFDGFGVGQASGAFISQRELVHAVESVQVVGAEPGRR